MKDKGNGERGRARRRQRMRKKQNKSRSYIGKRREVHRVKREGRKREGERTIHGKGQRRGTE